MTQNTTQRPIFVATDEGEPRQCVAFVKQGGGFTRDDAEAQRWNGWAMPLFARAEMDVICRQTAEDRDDFGLTDYVEQRGDEFVRVVDGEEFPITPVDVDGVWAWSVDGWTWDTVATADVVVSVVRDMTGTSAPLPQIDDADRGVATMILIPDTGATYLIRDVPSPDDVGFDIVWDTVCTHVLGAALNAAMGGDLVGITTETVCERFGWGVDDFNIAVAI